MFQVNLSFIISPGNFALVALAIGSPSIKQGGNCGECGRLKLMTSYSSFVLLQFSCNKFSLDHVFTWSTACCTWLGWPFGIVSDTVVSSTSFHILKISETDKSLIMRRKNQGPSLVPWGTQAGTFPLADRQSLSSLTLWCLSEKKSIIQLMMLLGISISFNLVIRKPRSNALR